MMLRKTAILPLFLFFAGALDTSAQQVSGTAIRNVFQIHGMAGYGSGFTIQEEGREYLITANHVLAGAKANGSPESIEIRNLTSNGENHDRKLEWRRLTVKIFASKEADVAIIVPDEPLRNTAALKPRTGQVGVGQDVYFLGFPLGIALPVGGVNDPFPMPFVKRGIFSNADEKGRMYFDGYNNPGFSGGPVVYRAIWGSDADPAHFYVAGVITGFIPELTRVKKWRNARQNEDLAAIEEWRLRKIDGRTEVLEDTQEVVPLNSGIVVATSIKQVLELIKLHPIGPLTPGRS